MTARRRKRVARGAQGRREAGTRLRSSIARVEGELPPTLAQFSRRVRSRLGGLETRIEKEGARYRRSWARLLREASHQLGRFEAAGERRWKRLTAQARRDALKVLRRLEREIEPPRRRRRANGPRLAIRPSPDTPDPAA